MKNISPYLALNRNNIKWFLIIINYLKFNMCCSAALIVYIVLLLLYITVVVLYILPTYYDIETITINMDAQAINTCSSELYNVLKRPEEPSLNVAYELRDYNSFSFYSADSDNIVVRFLNLFNSDSKFNCSVKEEFKNTFCKNKFISDKLVNVNSVPTSFTTGLENNTNLLPQNSINLPLKSNKLLFFIDSYLYKLEELLILKGIIKP